MKIFARDDSSFWFVEFSVEGKRFKRSTKVLRTEPVSKAQRRGAAMVEAVRLKKSGMLTSARVEQLVTETVMAAEGRVLSPFDEVVEGYLKEKEMFIKPATRKGRSHSLSLFVRFLAGREMSRGEVEKWRDSLAQSGCTYGTMRTYLNGVADVCKYAVEKGLYPVVYTERVKVPPTPLVAKAPVFADDVRRLLQVTPYAEWQTILRFAYYHGLRMGDCCCMKWGSLDLVAGRMAFYPSKQRLGKERALSIPLHPEMLEHLKALRAGVVGSVPEYVSPKTAANYRKARHTPGNLAQRLFKKSGVKGSFHGLRHGFVTTLARAGVSSDLRKHLTHHKDGDIHSLYTHFDDGLCLDALRKIEKL